MSQPFDTEQYRNAISGKGEQAGQWADKPHRLVYDLCSEVERLQLILLELGHKEHTVPPNDGPIGWDAIKDRLDQINSHFEETS